MKTKQILFPVLFLCAILIFSFSACSSSPKDCTGEITVNGKTYNGKAKNPEKAKQNACNKYCLDSDPECDAMYGIWVSSPKGKAAGSPPKQKAIYEEKKLLDCVTIKCANKCMENIKAGTIRSKVSCK